MWPAPSARLQPKTRALHYLPASASCACVLTCMLSLLLRDNHATRQTCNTTHTITGGTAALLGL